MSKAPIQLTELLFLHAQTSLHPGSGTALGVVDLPVQRERHTQWPTIPGSALKGILRDACRRRAGNGDDLYAAFGPETQEADKHAGAISLTDARILAFPVRSLRGVFAWVTCPAVLERLHRDLKLNPALEQAFPLKLPSAPGKDKALCPEKAQLLVDDNRLVLEEFEFERTGDAGDVPAWIARAVPDEFTQKRIETHLVVLHDDDFTHFVRHATEIVARIGLDYEKKTVRQGALFYQECLPAETLFYSVVFANPSRRDNTKDAAAILSYLHQQLPQVLQIGGDETTGKGLWGKCNHLEVTKNTVQ
jgi:CRISPR-associated protein Cmr4